MWIKGIFLFYIRFCRLFLLRDADISAIYIGYRHGLRALCAKYVLVSEGEGGIEFDFFAICEKDETNKILVEAKKNTTLSPFTVKAEDLLSTVRYLTYKAASEKFNLISLQYAKKTKPIKY